MTPADYHRSYLALGPSPLRAGPLTKIILRKPDEGRETPISARLCVRRGMVGDRWELKKTRKPDAQVSLMNHRVLQTIAGDTDPAEAGDNLIVDLDLSVSALPVGSRLQVGEALLEVTPEPHTGCKKFRRRFGLAALQWANAKEHRGLRFRGLYCRVIRGGMVQIGDIMVHEAF